MAGTIARVAAVELHSTEVGRVTARTVEGRADPMSHEALIAAARRDGATVLETPGATIIIVIPARVADGDDLLPVKQAAELAKCSVRTLRSAWRSGELAVFGKQRSRAVRRADLLAWIDSRRVESAPDLVDDLDIERRMKRLARAS